MDLTARMANSAMNFTTIIVKPIAASTWISAKQTLETMGSTANLPKIQILFSQIFLTTMLLQRSPPLYESQINSQAGGIQGKVGEGIAGSDHDDIGMIRLTVLSKCERITNLINRSFRRSTWLFKSRIQQLACYGIHQTLLCSCLGFTAYVASNVVFNYDIKTDDNRNGQNQIAAIDEGDDLMTELLELLLKWMKA